MDKDTEILNYCSFCHFVQTFVNYKSPSSRDKLKEHFQRLNDKSETIGN